MPVSRYPLISGFSCIAPAPLVAAGLRDGTPLDWYEVANSVSLPVGFAPGSAFFLMSRANGDELGKNDAHTISWVTENGTTVLSGYYLFAQTLVSLDGDSQAAYLVELRDKRQVLRSGIDRRYNYLKPLPFTLADTANRIASKYFTDSLNGGSLWTWATLWANLWAQLPAAAGSAPSLPYTPAGTPKNFEFSDDAWLACEEFLAAITCTIAYNPITEAFTVVRLSAAQTGLAAALTAANTSHGRMFDLSPRQSLNAARKPSSWFVLGPRQHSQHDGHSHFGTETSVNTSITGAIGQIGIWDRTPTTFCPGGAAQNAAEVTARHNDIATERTGKANNSDEYYGVQFRGLLTSILTGSQISEVVWRDYGDKAGLVTELHQRPIGLLDRGRLDIDTEKIIRVRLTAELTKGSSAAAVVVTYDHVDGQWENDVCTLTVWDALESIESLPVGTALHAKYHYDSERWEIIAPAGSIVRFRLVADLDLGSSAEAKILTWDGAAWQLSSERILVYDWFNTIPTPIRTGMFRGHGDADNEYCYEGWAQFREALDPEVTNDRDKYDIIWMENKARFITFKLLEKIINQDEPFEAQYEIDIGDASHGFSIGRDPNPDENTIDVYDVTGTFFGAPVDAIGIAKYNDRNDHYEIVRCQMPVILAEAKLNGNLCGATEASIKEFSAFIRGEFMIIPDPLPTYAANLTKRQGKDGFLVYMFYDLILEEWNIFQIEPQIGDIVHDVKVNAEGRLFKVFTKDANYESCKDPQELEIPTELCDDS